MSIKINIADIPVVNPPPAGSKALISTENGAKLAQVGALPWNGAGDGNNYRLVVVLVDGQPTIALEIV